MWQPLLVTRRTKPLPRRARRGLALLDALVGSFIAALMGAGIFALVPNVTKSQELADDQSRATHIANRMIEHLQLLKPSDITPDVLNQLDLVDPGSTGSPYSFTHVALDEGSGYSPAKMLRDADAEFDVVPISSASVRIDVKIQYRSASGNLVTYKTGTILGGYR